MEFTEALGTLFAACELGPIYIFKEHMGGGGRGGVTVMKWNYESVVYTSIYSEVKLSWCDLRHALVITSQMNCRSVSSAHSGRGFGVVFFLCFFVCVFFGGGLHSIKHRTTQCFVRAFAQFLLDLSRTSLKRTAQQVLAWLVMVCVCLVGTCVWDRHKENLL